MARISYGGISQMILEEEDFYIQNDKNLIEIEKKRFREKLLRIKNQREEEIRELQSEFMLEYGGEG